MPQPDGTNDDIEILRQRVAELEAENRQLKKQKHFLRSGKNSAFNLFETLPILIYTNDQNYRLTYANNNVANLCSSPLKQHCYEALFARDTPCDDCFINDRQNSYDGIKCGIERTGSDGRVYRFWICPFADENGRVEFFHIGLDVTEYKYFQHPGFTQDLLFEPVFAYSPDAMVITDINRRIIKVNPAFSDTFGYPDGETTNRPVSLLHANKAAFNNLGKLRTDNSASDFSTQEISCRSKHGDYFISEVRTAPIKDKSGLTIGFLATYRDISDRKQLELEKQRTLVELEKRMQMRTMRLISMNAKMSREINERKSIEEALRQAKKLAEQANNAKSIFLATMSHEIRTPLNGVMGMLQLLNDTQLNGDQLEYCSLAGTSARALLSLLEDILDFSKIEADKIHLECRRFPLEQLLEDIRTVFKIKMEQKEITFSIDRCSRTPVYLMGDPQRLRQILYNLVGNACNFTRNGNICLKVEQAPSDQAPEQPLQAGGLCRLLFTISDTGIGIPENKLDTIFNPFEQADNGYNRKSQGVGLGLAIVYKLVKHLGGDVTVASREGEGTDFRVTLNFLLPQETGEAGKDSDSSSQLLQNSILAGKHLLVVDDEQLNRKLISRLLENRKCTVSAAESGPQALALLESQSFDCILMDVQMPEMDGLAATRAMRDSGRYGEKASTPIVALTAHTTRQDREACFQAGMNAYLSKPIDANLLSDTLCSVLSEKLT